MLSVLIVESPAKCSKIQGFLGSGWKVVATMGHIRALDDTLDAVGLDRDFDASFVFLKDKARAIQQIKDVTKGASVFLASDDDREGEAISYSVAVLLGLDVTTTPRIVFHEITKEAITNALKAPKRIAMDRVNAQQARAILDKMVGYTISPLLWKFVGQGLSAGRCQTPALRLVVEREDAIAGFRSETTWSIKGTWKTKVSVDFSAALTSALEDEESALNYMENVNDDPNGVVKVAETKPTSVAAPKPLITSTLQQEASALYGSQPKNTMRIAQKLYEAGYITYMRTDHPVLSEEAVTEAKAYIQETFGEEYVLSSTISSPTKKTKKAVLTNTQEAHEAIRPTHISTVDLPSSEDWSVPERKLYKLIWNRTLQSVMPAYRGEDRNVFIVCLGDPGEMEWRATWHRTTFPGWKRVGQAVANLDGDEEKDDTENAAWTLGQTLDVGDHILWTTMETVPKETRASPRFTEATLVRELERCGIGRPSTFAPLIDTIIEKKYVEKVDTEAKQVAFTNYKVAAPLSWPPTKTTELKKVGAEKNKLVPTALGRSALDFCVREFGALFEYGFTKQMEEGLDLIATGRAMWKDLCRDTWAIYRTKYEEMKAAPASVVQTARQKLFAGGIKAVQSKKGPLLLIEGATSAETAFYGWPGDDVAFSTITEEQAVAHVAACKREKAQEIIGEYDGAPMLHRTGPYGPYVVCGSAQVPWVEGDTVETIQAKLKAKQESVLHTVGPFEFRRGPYGIYMFKKDIVGKGRKFVGLPSAVDPKVLTLEAATALYQSGLQQKAKARAYGNKGHTAKYLK
jgi:DNA topoisomerase-1